jgi:glycosyltransferase involved in cell wall biosynthesis
MPASPPQISAVAPVYNEVESLDELHRQLAAGLAATGRDYEIILVDDGSTDGSRDKLRALAAADPRLTVLFFRRNFGQTAAMQAGFDAARGELIVPLDADLQNDPADIAAMVAKLEAEGWDIVCGWRKDRQDTGLRRLPSRIANRLIVRITGVDIHDTGCTLKVFRRETLAPVRLYGQLHRFIPQIAAAYGARITDMPVRHHPRRHGVSKYGLGRTTKVILDLILVKFLQVSLQRPIHAFGRWALLSYALAVPAGVVALGQTFAGRGLGWWLTTLVLLALGSQLLAAGLLSEMLTRIYHEGTGRRTYLVAEVLNPPPTES